MALAKKPSPALKVRPTKMRACKGRLAQKPKAAKKPQHKSSASQSTWPKPDEPIIFLRENHKPPASQTRARYQRYRNAGTVTEALAMGATMADLKNDLKKGLAVRSENMENMDMIKCVRLFASDGKEPIAFQQPNPKVPNSKSWKRYEQYRHAVTIEECKSFGVWPGDIRNDLARGFLKFGHSNQRVGVGSKVYKVPRKSRLAALRRAKGAAKKVPGAKAPTSAKAQRSSKRAAESKDVSKRKFQLPWNKKCGWV